MRFLHFVNLFYSRRKIRCMGIGSRETLWLQHSTFQCHYDARNSISQVMLPWKHRSRSLMIGLLKVVIQCLYYKNFFTFTSFVKCLFCFHLFQYSFCLHLLNIYFTFIYWISIFLSFVKYLFCFHLLDI